MNWKRIATLGVMVGSLVTLLARASTSVAPPSVPAPAGATTPDLTSPTFPDMERLRARLRAPIGPAAPSRNLFAYQREAPRSVAAVAAPVIAAPAVAAPSPRAPGFTFVGLAEESGPDGLVRTAILSAGRDLLFAKAGDVIGGYRVSTIGGETLELIATDDGAAFVLTLK